MAFVAILVGASLMAAGAQAASGGNPTLVGTVEDTINLDGAVAVAVNGNYAYVASSHSDSLSVIDITTPGNPTLVGTVKDATNLDGAVAVAVNGNYAYVASHHADSLSVIDITTPGNPTIVGTLKDTTNLDLAYGVAVKGNYVYVVSYSADSLSVIYNNIIYGSNPTIVGTVKDATNLNGANAVAVSGNYAYVASTEAASLSVIDITTAGNPTIVGTVKDTTNLSGARLVAVSGNYAYVASYSAHSLSVIDITTPGNPTIVGTVKDATNLNGATGVAVSGNFAYVAGAEANSLSVIDITIPGNPTIVGTVKDTTKLHYAYGVAASGNYVYVTSFLSQSLSVIDITTPGNPMPAPIPAPTPATGLSASSTTTTRFWGYAPTMSGLDANTCGQVANASCGPSDWDEVDGTSLCEAPIAPVQSPIALNTASAMSSDTHVAIKLLSDPRCSKGGMYNVDPHGIEVNINTSCQPYFNVTWDVINRTNVYKLEKYTFHTPSEHALDGQFFDMEAHLVHSHTVTGDKLVLAVFMKSDPSLKAKCLTNGGVHITCQRANFVESIFHGGMMQNETVPAVAAKLAPESYTRYMNASIDPYLGFVPPLGFKYYTYNGSLTTPPCTTGVQWILHAVPVFIYNTTVDLWKNISGAYVDNGLTQGAVNHTQNARAIQAMDGRTLYVGGKTGYSVISQAALAGTNVLAIVDHAGFAIGDNIIIEAGTSRQEGNTVASIGSLVTSTPLHYSHPAGAWVYSQTTTSPAITLTPAAGAVTTTPVATVTPSAPLQRYTDGKYTSNDQDKTGFASGGLIGLLAVGGLIGFSVVMIVRGARSRMRGHTPTATSYAEILQSKCPRDMELQGVQESAERHERPTEVLLDSL